jgi:GDP-fucose transporter C1
MVTLTNMCLRDVDVSFYLVARSLTIVFSVVFSWVFLGSQTSVRSVVCCIVVIAGFALGSYGEVNFSLRGWLYGVVSSAFVALYGTFASRALVLLKNDRELLLMYNTILSILLVVPFVLLNGELDAMRESAALREWYTWGLLSLSGVLGILVGIATFWQIAVTSPLTSTICGNAKASVQTLMAVAMFGNPVSALNAAGIALVLIGSTLYGLVRYVEMGSENEQKSNKGMWLLVVVLMVAVAAGTMVALNGGNIMPGAAAKPFSNVRNDTTCPTLRVPARHNWCPERGDPALVVGPNGKIDCAKIAVSVRFV